MLKNRTNYLFLFFIALNSSWSSANESPFWVTADLPIMLGLGLPKALSAHSPALGETYLIVNGVVKSNANDAGAVNETLILDGESQSLDFGLEYGLTEKWSLDLQLAYIKHSGGSLDGLIQSWHDIFSLSDGDRPLFEENDFNFSYQNVSGQNKITKSTSGISDLRIGIGYALPISVESSRVKALMLRAGLNLPTGEANKLIGSEKLDFDAGLYVSGKSQQWKKLGWHINLGYLYIGDDSQFGISTKQHAWFNSLGLSWNVNPKLQVRGQLDTHSALFESKIDEINQHASQLTLGVAYDVANVGVISFYISEDVTVNRAADFSIGLSVQALF